MKNATKILALVAAFAAAQAHATITVPAHVTATPNPAAVNQPVTLGGSIEWQEGQKPSGTFDFFDGGTPIAACQDVPYPGNGDPALCSTSFSAGGSHTLTVTYSGDATYSPVTSGPYTMTVDASGKYYTTVELTSDNVVAGPGQFPVFTAVIRNSNGTATGTVTMFDGLVQLRDCTDVPVVSGQAQCHAPLSRGQHPITARYSGDDLNNGSTSNVWAQNSVGRKALVDFDGDNKGDLLFVNRSDNSVQMWLMDGTTVKSQPMVAGPSTLTAAWSAGDFNGDGYTDLVAGTSDGAATMYLISSGAVTTQQQLRAPGSGWHLTDVADFNNDGRADILWRSDSGAVEMWLMDGTTIVQQATIMPAGTAWRVAKVGDFDGDGRADLVWVNDADGSVGLWIMDGTTRLDRTTLLGPGSGWMPAGLADFNDDGKADIVWRNTDGSVGLWMMQGTQLASRTSLMGPGTGWAPVLVNDFANAIYWKSSDGSVGLWLWNGSGFSHYSLMGPGSAWTPTAIQSVNGSSNPNTGSDILWTSTGGSVGLWMMGGGFVSSRTNLLPDGTPWRLVNEEIAPNSP